MTGTILKANSKSLLPEIKRQTSDIFTSWELVRLDNPIIADQSNREVIAQMLIELNSFLNIARKMSGDQIVRTVNMLLQQYPRLSLQEYQVFFNRIQAGHFGNLYDSLDGTKIMVFMKEFYREMVNAYYDFKEEKHQQIKQIEEHRDL